MRPLKRILSLSLSLSLLIAGELATAPTFAQTLIITETENGKSAAISLTQEGAPGKMVVCMAKAPSQVLSCYEATGGPMHLTDQNFTQYLARKYEIDLANTKPPGRAPAPQPAPGGSAPRDKQGASGGGKPAASPNNGQQPAKPNNGQQVAKPDNAQQVAKPDSGQHAADAATGDSPPNPAPTGDGRSGLKTS